MAKLDIKKAIKKPGSLRKSLGIKKGKTIPASKLKAAAVLDRSESFANRGGPVFNEVRSALYESSKKPLIVNYIYGLGGRDINTKHIESVYTDLDNITKQNKVETLINYLGVRN